MDSDFLYFPRNSGGGTNNVYLVKVSKTTGTQAGITTPMFDAYNIHTVENDTDYVYYSDYDFTRRILKSNMSIQNSTIGFR